MRSSVAPAMRVLVLESFTPGDSGVRGSRRFSSSLEEVAGSSTQETKSSFRKRLRKERGRKKAFFAGREGVFLSACSCMVA